MPKELRVHGVSGTPPREMLYSNPVTYDQTDELAKVFEPVRDDWDVRAFHWGSLTSKSSWTAFWILLAPFAMANVAGWMSESASIWSRIWIRVAGIALTGIFFAQLANMALDIPFAAGTSPDAVFRIYLATSTVVVIGVGLLSTQSSFKHLGVRERLGFLFGPSVDSMQPTMKRTSPEWDDPSGDFGIVGYRMWTIHSIVHRLRRLHLTFGMSVLAMVGARAVDAGWVETIAVSLAGVVMLSLVFTTGAFAERRALLALTGVLPLAGIAMLAWSLALLGTGEISAGNIADDVTYEIALILGAAAGLGFVGEAVRGRLRTGLAPLGLLAVATLVGATFGLTGAMLVESYLTTSETTRNTFDRGSALVTLGMLGLVITMMVSFLIAMGFSAREEGESRARAAILKGRSLLAVAGAYGLAFGVLAVIASCAGPAPGCGRANIELPLWVVEDPGNLVTLLGLPFDPTSLLGWAKLLMVAVPSALIIRSIVGGLLNGQDARRQVGILWDLGSFWPRWFHPLGPPAYGPYAVSRLQSVIDQEKPDVVAAHSQGSLLTAVALCLTDVDAVPRLFVSYGSQIGHLYPALFPAVGFNRLIASAAGQLGERWINLWRRTDVVGGQLIPALGERNWEVITGTGHSSYELTPEFCAARETVSTWDPRRPSDLDMADCWES
ncbi:MAG: hypothetical protein PVF87_02920 [Acidimicrobiia bacterium]